MVKFKRYQRLDEIGVPGKRDVAARAECYGLAELLTPQTTLLDIGCNRGLFCLWAAEHVQEAIGVDYSRRLIRDANRIAEERGATNCRFVCAPFEPGAITGGPFDLILALSIHGHVSITMEQFADEVVRLLAPGGHLLIEGHRLDKRGGSVRQEVFALLDQRLQRVRDGRVPEGRYQRPFVLYRKTTDKEATH
jgi:2-polyprenyl-3-methyl-5-hydroxy-6-metoxy-1,4-benzoquinol methylase